MDDIVRQAMAKWPNVPHCYGWLALDARGNWRMRDERAQALGLPGDTIRHPALVGFIHRNYLSDERGCWYFQNGPQRVFVSLEVAPFVARTDPAQGFVLHTGDAFAAPDGAWMTGSGRLLLSGGGRIAALDDRDLAHCLETLRMDGKPVDEDALSRWLAASGAGGSLTLEAGGAAIPVGYLDDADVAARFGFVPAPRPA